jgi:undecaprenyl-phosphate 4-deoxy-4-formamido-L-arabinose transferase
MNPKYSVVIPILNEEESIEELLTQIDDAFKKLKEAYEILFVDDGSTDSTLEILKKTRPKKQIYPYLFF